MPLRVTYIGHATTLIEWEGCHFLTDPVFSSRILCFKRFQPLPFDPSKLPKLDAILLSHAHYDHLDLFSYKYIPSEVPIIIPEGMSRALKGLVKNPIVELATWSKFALSGEFQICAVPAKHKGGRFLLPCRYRTCHGYVLMKGSEGIYFAGDTAYGTHFSNIRSLFKPKLALFPLGVTSNRFWGKKHHMDLSAFIQGWEDLGMPDVIPIHWGTFFLTFRHVQNFQAMVEKTNRPDFIRKLHILEAGTTLTL